MAGFWGAVDVRASPSEDEVPAWWRVTPPSTAVVDARAGRRSRSLEGPVEVLLDGERIAAHEVVPTDGKPLPSCYLLVVDDVFSMPDQRNRVLERIAAAWPSLAPADRVAVVAWDGEALDVLTEWTRSPLALQAAMSAARERPAQGPKRLAEQRQLESSLRATGRDRGGPASFSGTGFIGSTQVAPLGAVGLARAREITDRVAGVIEAAAGALDVLAPPDPDVRTALILMTGGWLLSPDSWVLDEADGSGPYAGMVAARHLLTPLVEAADRAAAAVYPLVLPTWGASGRSRSARRALEPARAGSALAEGLLVDLAETTGGRLVADLARPLAMPFEDAGGYRRFVLHPEWREDDDRRMLRIVSGGSRATAREGLSDPGRERTITRLLRVADLLGRATPDARQWKVETVVGSGGTALSIDVAAGALEATSAAALELRIDTADGKPPTLEQPPRPDAGKRLTYQTRATWSARETLLVSLFDPARGTLLATRVSVKE